jgi:iron complex transport system ATP-binding protein
MLSVENLSFKYEKKPILENISLTIPTGKIVGFIGPNGCGKSTLLKLMANMLKPQEGTVKLSNNLISKIPNKDLAKKMTLLPQNKQNKMNLTVYELVSFGRYPHLPWHKRLSENDHKMVDWALEQTNLSQFKKRRLLTLSGGEAQRAFIAMALAQESPLLLLDEPTTFLDISHQLDVLNLLNSLNKSLNRTIVMVLHDINQAVRYCDTIHIFNNNILQNSNDSNQILNSSAIRNAFDIDIRVHYDQINNCPYGLMDRPSQKYNEKII